MTRDPAACLSDMLEHAQHVEAFVAGMDREAFETDRKTQFAVLRGLEVVGEAAKRVSPEIQARFPDIPWRQIVGMRNVIAHDYLGLSLSMVYETATVFIPRLIMRLPEVIASLERETRG